MWVNYLAGDSLEIKVRTFTGDDCPQAYAVFYNGGIYTYTSTIAEPFNKIPGTPYQRAVHHDPNLTGSYSTNMRYVNCDCQEGFELNKLSGHFGIVDLYHLNMGDMSAAYYTDVFPGYGGLVINPSYNPGSPGTSCHGVPSNIRRKILLGKVGRYDGADNENWVKTQEVTKYNWYGAELENKEEGIGYNAAIYGYNQQLPVCVVKKARHNQVLFDGMEDYDLLRSKPSIREKYSKLIYSPIAAYVDSCSTLGSLYKRSTLTGTGVGFYITNDEAHTGIYSLRTTSAVSLPLNGSATGMTKGYSFSMDTSRKYVASIWLKAYDYDPNNPGHSYSGSVTVTEDTTMGSASSALLTSTLTAKSNIIDGWQQYEVVFAVPHGYKNFKLNLGSGFYYDDVRIYPFESNSKGFVYHPVTRKLMATLDENNYATFYEYDAEGNLIRTKKETEQGILTVSESRSTHHKAN
jgi:hypothetical protein